MNDLNGFAVWITGLPASGKSTIAAELAKALRQRGLLIVVLESDVMRKILTPNAAYTDAERDRFYLALARIGAMITKSGVNVIFDATANKQSYRDQARKMIPRFLEAYVNCPVEVCRKRDPKGIYRMAAEGKTATVPGVQSLYEHPEHPDVVLDCTESAGAAAITILDKLKQLLYI